MADISVNPDVIYSAHMAAYFAQADRRILIGFRVALEVLGIPLPAYAYRKPAGRPPVTKAVNAAYQADERNGGTPRPVSRIAPDETREAYLLRRKVENAQARIDRSKADAAGSLFDQTFPG